MMNVWEFLRQVTRGYIIGMKFQTSLLGEVPYILNEYGDWIGLIPVQQQESAMAHGFMIVGTDWKNDRYILQVGIQ